MLIPSGPVDRPGMRHLHIVCTDPCVESKQLVVSVTTWRNNLCDDTCLLDEEDHPWLKHKSWVMYRAARIETALTLDNGVGEGLFTVCDPVNHDVFGRVLRGICASPHTKTGIKRYFSRQLAGVASGPF